MSTLERSSACKSINFDSYAIYKGWIPTITGRLSFTLVGDSSFPDVAHGTNVSDDEVRYILCYQRRSEVDTVLPFKLTLARWLFHLDGDHVAVCLSFSSNDPRNSRADLKGYVYWFHRYRNWDRVRSVIETIQNELEEASDYRRVKIAKDNHWGFIDSKHQILQNFSLFFAPFRISRSGECTIYSQKHIKVSRDAPDFSDSPSDKEHERDLICDQLFYFLKDITHAHQHHSPRTDSLSTLHRVERGDKGRWKHEVIRSLTLSVLRMKRERGHFGATKALGILAYLSSFRSVFDPQRKIIPGYSEEYLSQSVRAMSEQDKEDLARKNKSSDTVRNTIIGVSGVALSVGSLFSISRDSQQGYTSPAPDALLQLLGYLLIEYFHLFLMILVVVLFLYWGYRTVFSWEKIPPVRDLVRLLSPLGKWVSVSALTIIGISVISVATIILPDFNDDNHHSLEASKKEKPSNYINDYPEVIPSHTHGQGRN